jgi:hypothetical protein
LTKCPVDKMPVDKMTCHQMYLTTCVALVSFHFVTLSGRFSLQKNAAGTKTYFLSNFGWGSS